MNRQRVMLRAHEIARGGKGQYRVQLAAGLRQAWTEEKALRAGGKLWERNDIRRIYINDLIGLYGLEVECYNTGNPRFARLNGRDLSNTKARGIMFRLQAAKIWFDLTDGRWHGKDIDQDDFDTIVAAIKAA